MRISSLLSQVGCQDAGTCVGYHRARLLIVIESPVTNVEVASAAREVQTVRARV